MIEKGGSQIELQGGYGGGSFIGTLGLSFNNFSIRNLSDSSNKLISIFANLLFIIS